MKLSDQGAIVTAGAGAGIGQAKAETKFANIPAVRSRARVGCGKVVGNLSCTWAMSLTSGNVVVVEMGQ